MNQPQPITITIGNHSVTATFQPAQVGGNWAEAAHWNYQVTNNGQVVKSGRCLGRTSEQVLGEVFKISTTFLTK